MSGCCLRRSAAARLDAACVGWEKLLFALMGFQLTLKTQQLFFFLPSKSTYIKGTFVIVSPEPENEIFEINPQT